jgi:hypothetical protein
MPRLKKPAAVFGPRANSSDDAHKQVICPTLQAFYKWPAETAWVAVKPTRDHRLHNAGLVCYEEIDLSKVF